MGLAALPAAARAVFLGAGLPAAVFFFKLGLARDLEVWRLEEGRRLAVAGGGETGQSIPKRSARANET